jgi:hypothetical protein
MTGVSIGLNVMSGEVLLHGSIAVEKRRHYSIVHEIGVA